MSKPERYNVPSYPGHLAPDELEVIYEKACRDLADDSLGRLDPASLKQPVPFEFLFRALAPMMVQMHWQRDRIAMLESLLAATGNVWSQAIATTPDATALLGDAASLDTDALLDAAGLLAEALPPPDDALLDSAAPMNGVASLNAATPLNDGVPLDDSALLDEAVHLNTIALLDTAAPLNGAALKNKAGQLDAAVPMKAVGEPNGVTPLNGTTLKNSAGLMEAVVRMNATAPMKATRLPNAAAPMKAATPANSAETPDAVMLLEGLSPSKVSKPPMVIRLREPVTPPPPLTATKEPLTIVKTPRGPSEQKLEPVLPPQVQQNNEIEHNRDSENSGHAPAPELPEVSNPPNVAKAQTSLKAPTIKAPTLNVHVKSRKM